MIDCSLPPRLAHHTRSDAATPRVRLARLFAAALTASLLFPLPAGAGQPPPVADAQPHLQQTDAAPKRGLFYEVTDGGHLLYLFGTIHVGKPEYYPLNSAVISAFERAQYLAVEADVSDDAAIAAQVHQFAMYPPGDSLDKHVSAQLMQKVQPLLAKYNFPLEQALRMKPWLLALTLDYVGGAEAGFSPQYGADVFLLGLAKQMHKPVAEVESMQFQIHLFDSMTAGEQEDYLQSTVDALDSGEFHTEMLELVDAWAKADSKAVTKAIEDGQSALAPSVKWIGARLITDRNTTMTRRVEDYLRSGNLYFVAVGAGHLVGSEGIVAKLKAAGFRVRDLQ